MCNTSMSMQVPRRYKVLLLLLLFPNPSFGFSREIAKIGGTGTFNCKLSAPPPPPSAHALYKNLFTDTGRQADMHTAAVHCAFLAPAAGCCLVDAIFFFDIVPIMKFANRMNRELRRA